MPLYLYLKSSLASLFSYLQQFDPFLEIHLSFLVFYWSFGFGVMLAPVGLSIFVFFYPLCIRSFVWGSSFSHEKNVWIIMVLLNVGGNCLNLKTQYSPQLPTTCGPISIHILILKSWRLLRKAFHMVPLVEKHKKTCMSLFLTLSHPNH